MSGSPNTNIILALYSSQRTVFTLTDIALITGESNFTSLNRKLNYYVRRGKIYSPRKGIYTKAEYNPQELSCVLYTPSYISLEYVLQKAGIIFQYDERLTAVSYLSRNITIENRVYQYRKIKGEILIITKGIQQIENINIATPERALLDMLYLNSNLDVENVSNLNQKLIDELMPVYNSATLTLRAKRIMKNG